MFVRGSVLTATPPTPLSGPGRLSPVMLAERRAPGSAIILERAEGAAPVAPAVTSEASVSGGRGSTFNATYSKSVTSSNGRGVVPERAGKD